MTDTPELRGVLDTPLTPHQWELYQANARLVTFTFKRICRRLATRLAPLEAETLRECLDNRLIRAAQSYRPELGWQFTTFAITCMARTGWQDYQRMCRRRVANKSLDVRLRDASGDTMLVFADGIDADAERDANLDYRARVAWITRVVGPQRAAWLIRHFVEEVSYRDMAREQGCSTENVRQKIQAALVALRRAAGRGAA